MCVSVACFLFLPTWYHTVEFSWSIILIPICYQGQESLLERFNEINHYHYLMLWNVVHHWNSASRFVFNCYHRYNIVYVQNESSRPFVMILSKEGIA